MYKSSRIVAICFLISALCLGIEVLIQSDQITKLQAENAKLASDLENRTPMDLGIVTVEGDPQKHAWVGWEVDGALIRASCDLLAGPDPFKDKIGYQTTIPAGYDQKPFHLTKQGFR